MEESMVGPESQMIARTPILDRLRQQKAKIERQLSEVNEAIKVLESNPGFVEALDVLGKVSNRIY